ncbi:MAG: class I SAM-dependent methyltransferase [Thermoflexales bacterium]|nr:class I SAM-dependent methyltransferase [Thermoflexales bacterium]
MDTLSSTEFYERLAGVFDVMTDWQARLAFEMPFLRQTLERCSARRVLDAACGTGWHAISLAQAGYAAEGCDASPAMIQQARANAVAARVDVPFQVADLTELGAHLSPPFDAILCLGNSLPHLLSPEALTDALGQMHALLRTGGVLVLHNLNYDLRLEARPRFFQPAGDACTLVWRFADYGPELITFHTAIFERTETGSWSVHVNSTPQRPLLARELGEALEQVGFERQSVQHFGGLDGSPFEIDTSGDLVIVGHG